MTPAWRLALEHQPLDDPTDLERLARRDILSRIEFWADQLPEDSPDRALWRRLWAGLALAVDTADGD